jgi:uncharacterized membrane protein
MQGQAVGVGAVADWYGRGWANFRAQPGPWIALLLLYVVIVLAGQLVPVIGAAFVTLLAPALAAGMLHAAREGERDHAVELADLFAGVSEASSRRGLFLLGVLVLVATLVLGALFLVAAQALGLPVESGVGDSRRQALAGLVGLALLTAGLAAAMALFFAVPLVHFAGMAPLPALVASLRACLRNLVPLLVYGVSYSLLAILAGLPYGLGFLILAPVGVGANWACYTDIFAADHEESAGEVPPAA